MAAVAALAPAQGVIAAVSALTVAIRAISGAILANTLIL